MWVRSCPAAGGHPVFTRHLQAATPHDTTNLDFACRQTIDQISSAWAAYVAQGKKTFVLSSLTLLCFYFVLSHHRHSAWLFSDRVWTYSLSLVCVWREGPIISAVWEFKRHACCNLLFHSPGLLSNSSSFPVGYSSYPSTGKPAPPPAAAASDPELSS